MNICNSHTYITVCTYVHVEELNCITYYLPMSYNNVIMLECQTCIRYVIVLAILHILIGINKLQNRRIELQLTG